MQTITDMTLTSKDYQAIATQIVQGQRLIEYAKDDEVLWLECEYEEDGYREDDYFGGTGAFICTGTDLSVRSAYTINEAGETPNDFSVDRLYEALC